MAAAGMLLALAGGAEAQAPPKNPNITAAYWRCMGAVNIRSGNQEAIDAAFTACARREHAGQDRKLNEAYRNAVGQLDEAGKKRIQDVQRAWLRLRDDNCNFLAARSVTPAAQEFERAKCVMEWTANRANELEIAFYAG
jgi:uncharacterized protein YecT (DUF1311 family)